MSETVVMRASMFMSIDTLRKMVEQCPPDGWPVVRCPGSPDVIGRATNPRLDGNELVVDVDAPRVNGRVVRITTT